MIARDRGDLAAMAHALGGRLVGGLHGIKADAPEIQVSGERQHGKPSRVIVERRDGRIVAIKLVPTA